MPVPSPEALAKARLAVQQAKARLLAIENRQSEAERKLDTRRKIILGALLLDAATKDDRYVKVISALLARVERDNDRKAFNGWKPPTPQPTDGAVPTPASALDGQADD
ncbi:MAG: mobilization protein [Pseudomonadota bacterium]|nr:mobilization protein [Pseudomonadota bacterium]